MGGKFVINKAWFGDFDFQIEDGIDELSGRILKSATARAPVSQDRKRKGGESGYRTGSKTGFTVQVEITPEGPRIAAGSRTSASASRYIKTKKLSELTKKPGLNEYEYTFQRRKHGTLKKSGRVVEAEREGTAARGGVIFTAPYAWYVHQGKGKGRRTAKPFLLEALEDHRAEIMSGRFIKGKE